MNKKQALENLERIACAWLGLLGDGFTFDKAAVAQQSLKVIKEAIDQADNTSETT